jgi:hypothetical protein
MNRPDSLNTAAHAHEVDLNATRRRLLIAREQCGSHRSARQVAAMRRWPAPSARGTESLDG